MTKLVVVGRSGPNFREPRSLIETLQASVDYISEKQRQQELAACVSADSLPSEYALMITHSELDRVVTR